MACTTGPSLSPVTGSRLIYAPDGRSRSARSRDNLNLEALEFGDRTWALFFDPRRGFYGFAAYSKVIDEDEASTVDEFVVFRHRRDGRPDMSFGDRGRVFLNRGRPFSVDPLQVVRAADGDFIVAGVTGTKRRHVYLQRVNAGRTLGSGIRPRRHRRPRGIRERLSHHRRRCEREARRGRREHEGVGRP